MTRPGAKGPSPACVGTAGPCASIWRLGVLTLGVRPAVNSQAWVGLGFRWRARGLRSTKWPGASLCPAHCTLPLQARPGFRGPADPRGHTDCGRGAANPVCFGVQRTRAPLPRPRRCQGPRAGAGNAASCCLPQAVSGEGLGRTGPAIMAKGQGVSRTCCGPEHLVRGCEVRVEGPRGPDVGGCLPGWGRGTQMFSTQTGPSHQRS